MNRSSSTGDKPAGRVVHKEFVPGQGLITSSPFSAASSASKLDNKSFQRHRFQPAQEPTYDSSSSYYTSLPYNFNPTAPYAAEPQPRVKTLSSSILLPDDLRQYFLMQTQMLTACVEADDPIVKELPPKYQCIFPLESTCTIAGSSGYQTRVYKCLNVNDGQVYAVRRVDNARISSNLHYIVTMWKKVISPNVVPLHELFFQNKSLFLAHEFYPGAQTLESFIVSCRNDLQQQQQQQQLLPERIIWSILLQIMTAVRAVHAQGLACRDLAVGRILLTGKYRARVACAGLAHALEPSTTSTVTLLEQQFEDVLAVSKIAQCLATLTVIQTVDMSSTLSFMVKSGYSSELVQFALYPYKLREQEHKQCTIYDLIQLSASALVLELDTLYAHTDMLEQNLFKTFDCDRMFRIQLKLSLICERPALGQGKQVDSWSETGDRYVIKLFRDYVFHQVDDMGNAVVDLGHIIECLNKLDSGSMEEILLSSRDGKTFIVVTYDDVRRFVEASFQDLFPLV